MVLGCNSDRSSDTHADLLIKNVTVVSIGQAIASDATNVLVRDGKIIFIGDMAPNRVDDATVVIDGTNRFLMPGLVDSHTHLNEVPGMTFDHERTFPEIASDARNQIPRSYLYYGFTTVID